MKDVSDTNFSIDVGSDQDHERLVADIYFCGRYVCSVTEERGPGKFDLEINPSAPGVESIRGARCPLDGILEAIDVAATRLKAMKDLD